MKSKIINIFISLGLGILVIVLPFYYNAEHLDPVVASRLLLLNAVNVVLFFLLLFTKKGIHAFMQIIKFPAIWLYFLFLLYLLVRVNSAIVETEAIFVFLKHLNYFLLLSISAAFLANENIRITFYKIIAFLPPALAILCLYQAVQIPILEQDVAKHSYYAWYGSVSVEAYFANPNLFSIVCLLLLPFNGILFFLKLSRLWKILASLNSLFLLFVIFFIGGRSAMMGFFIATVFLLLSLFLKKQMNRGLMTTSFLLYFLALFSLCFSGNPIEKKWNALEGIVVKDADPDDPSRNASEYERYLMWKNSMTLAKEKPLLGIGPSNWPIAFAKVGAGGNNFLNRGVVQFRRPHNDFLLIFVELGIMGLLLYLSMFAYLIVYTINHYKLVKENLGLYFSLFGLISYFIIANLSYPSERIFPSILLMLTMAILVARIQTKKRPINNKSFQIVIPVVSILFLLGSIWWVNKRNQGEELVHQTFEAKRSNNWQYCQKSAELAERTTAVEIDPLGFPLQWYQGTSFHQLKMDKKALLNFRKAIKLSPYNSNLYNDLAGSFVAVKQLDSAVLYFNKALKISPDYYLARINLAIIYYNLSQYDLALENIDKILIKSGAFQEDYYFAAVPIYRAILKRDLALVENEFHRSILEELLVDDIKIRVLIQQERREGEALIDRLGRMIINASY